MLDIPDMMAEAPIIASGSVPSLNLYFILGSVFSMGIKLEYSKNKHLP